MNNLISFSSIQHLIQLSYQKLDLVFKAMSLTILIIDYCNYKYKFFNLINILNNNKKILSKKLKNYYINYGIFILAHISCNK